MISARKDFLHAPFNKKPVFQFHWINLKNNSNQVGIPLQKVQVGPALFEYRWVPLYSNTGGSRFIRIEVVPTLFEYRWALLYLNTGGSRFIWIQAGPA